MVINWIPVSERLPAEDGKSVLVAIDNERFCDWARKSQDNFRFYDSNYTGPVDIWNPIAIVHWAKEADWLTHWMPLPELPTVHK